MGTEFSEYKARKNFPKYLISQTEKNAKTSREPAILGQKFKKVWFD